MRHEFQKSEPRMKVEILGAASPVDPSQPGLPLYLSPVEAGFPSPAEDYLDKRLNLHTHVVKHEASTFFLRAHGLSMINAGINDGDLLIVDRSLPAEHNRVVIVALDGELTVKRLVRRGEKVFLVPKNPDYPCTTSRKGQLWGLV